MKKQEKIVAERDGEIRKFHPASWEKMPDGKYGWQQVRETVPPAVTANMAKAVKKPAKAGSEQAQTGDPLADK